jgi:uncharacterized protein
MISQATLHTVEAKRISKRLFNHWKHKFEVSEHNDHFKIQLPSAALTLEFLPDRLNLRLDSSLDDLTQLQTVVIQHLNRMAGDEFDVQWTTT